MVGWASYKFEGRGNKQALNQPQTPALQPIHPTLPSQAPRQLARNKTRRNCNGKTGNIFITPGRNWGDENPPEWRIVFQPGFVPFRSACSRFAGFGCTSDFQSDRHSGRSACGCRRNGFSISPAAFSRFAVFCRQARAESWNPGFGEFSQTGRGGMFGLRTFGKQAFVSRSSAFLSRQDAAACGSSVRRFWPPSAAAPPGLERTPGFRLSARAFKCDAAGFQRTLAHARNEAPDSRNARSGRNDGARKYLSRPRKAGTNF